MKRVLMTKSGVAAEETVELVEVADPTAGEGEVVVAVEARPVNPADLLLLEGRHAYTPTLPSTVGIEGVGVVVEAGEGAGVAVGARVALPFGGTWTERMAIAAREVIPVPASLDVEQAAMLSVNPFTAAGMLEGLREGMWVLQNAGTSAVARWVTALAAKRGLRSISVVRRDGVEDELRALGAEAVLVDGPDLAERVRAITGDGAARSLDAVAGAATGRMHAATADDGEVVVYGLLASDDVQLPAASLIFRSVVVRGFSRLRVLRGMSPVRREAIASELVDLLEHDSRCSTAIEARYPIAQVREAVRHHNRAARRGKIMLVG